MDDLYYLESIKGPLLDEFLVRGYYRMGMYAFTTHELDPNADGTKYPVYWLRYNVTHVALPTRNQQLLRKNAAFEVAIKSFELTDELVSLHAAYVASVNFKTAQTLRDNLHDTDNNVYDTHVIELRDNGKLIGAGIFDKGARSIAGIINIYDPAYRQRHSLGKYLMLLKYRYCLDHNIPYYYPGYFSPTYPVFDYKLFLDKKATEVFIPQVAAWIPYEVFADAILDKRLTD